MLHFLEGCFRNASKRVPNKTTFSYLLVQVIVNIINLNITLSYKQLSQLRNGSWHTQQNLTCCAYSKRVSSLQTYTSSGEFLDALRVYLYLF